MATINQEVWCVEAVRNQTIDSAVGKKMALKMAFSQLVCNERSSLLSLIVDCDESQRAARGSGSFAAALRACLASSDVIGCLDTASSQTRTDAHVKLRPLRTRGRYRSMASGHQGLLSLREAAIFHMVPRSLRRIIEDYGSTYLMWWPTVTHYLPLFEPQDDVSNSRTQGLYVAFFKSTSHYSGITGSLSGHMLLSVVARIP
jgi:hypothetical protein